MRQKRLTTPAKRRNFLKLAAVAGGSFAVTGVAGAQAPEAGVDGSGAVAPEAPSKGYRETAHVRAYYDKARF